MTSGNPLSTSTAGVTKLAATMIVGVIIIAAVLAPMLNDLTRETIVADYNNPDDSSWIRMNYGTGNYDTEYSAVGDTLTIGDQSGAAQDMILYADEKACVMYSDGFTIVNGYSDPATVVKAESVHITNADGTLTISDGTDIIIQTTSPAWAYYPDKEGTYGYFSADVEGVKVKDGNQAMAGKEFAGVYTYNDIVIGPDNIGDLGLSINAVVEDNIITSVTWAVQEIADNLNLTPIDFDPSTITLQPLDPSIIDDPFNDNSSAGLMSANPSNGTRIGDLYYTFSGTNATCIGYASTIDWTTFITIPNTVVNNGVTYIVTSIGDYTFYQCTNLALTSLPDGVTTIGTSAFEGCTRLALTSLPSGLTSIGEGAFRDCTNLTLTSLPEGITSIGISAFRGCTNLALTSIPSGLTSISSSTFQNCTRLALTSLPNGVTSIGSSAFNGCTNLALTDLPDGLTSIGGSAFRNCTNLTLTSLPDGLTTIGNNTFYGCTNLALTSIPSGVTSIGDTAFYECIGLESLVIQSASYISSNAFYGCVNLVEILDLGGNTIVGTNAEILNYIPAMGYVAPLSYTKVVEKEGAAYDILLMMPVLLVIALLIPIADYFVDDNIRSRIR